MKLTSSASTLSGSVLIPGSKSHTIRGVLIASLADGRSVLHHPLTSSDTEAAVQVYSTLGAKFDRQADHWIIDGIGGTLKTLQLPDGTELDTLNSGTTMNVALGTCSLLPEGNRVILTGDHQIQRRPTAPLVEALRTLGTQAVEVRDNGCPPIEMKGGFNGGEVTISCKNSQYLTSLLLAAPLAENDTRIHVPLLLERPYVQMTMDWMKKQGITFEVNEDMSEFFVPGRQSFKPFEGPIAADFSTACFFLVAGVLGENTITLNGLDINDSQGDKAVIDYLKDMGADITLNDDGSITCRASKLKGIDIDMNNTPDALPIMAVAACFAEGTTRLINVEQARIKETDRIAVMCTELKKMGADIEELPDGLVIRQSQLKGAEVQGHHDHRVVMSLTIAGSLASGETTVDTAEAAAVTVPQFFELMKELGMTINKQED